MNCIKYSKLAKLLKKSGGYAKTDYYQQGKEYLYEILTPDEEHIQCVQVKAKSPFKERRDADLIYNKWAGGLIHKIHKELYDMRRDLYQLVTKE